MKHLFFTLFLLINPSGVLLPQEIDTTWTRVYGGYNSDAGFSVVQTLGGGYILTGLTNSFGAGSDDVWLISTNQSGDTLWTQTYGGKFSDWATTVLQTKDSTYIIGGFTYSFGEGEGDFWLIKANSNGNIIWTKTFGKGGLEICLDVQQTSDTGFILVGWAGTQNPDDQDIFLVKTDQNGDTLWSRTFGGEQFEIGFEVQQTQSGDFILIGYTQSFGEGAEDVWLIKLDFNGNVLWDKTFGGLDEDVGTSVKETKDGNFIIAGVTRSFGAGERDIWIIKTNQFGDSLWTKTLGGTAGERVESICLTSDSGYIVAGYSGSFGVGSGDAWFVKLDKNGNILWQETYGGILDDIIWEIKQTSDSGYIAVGITDSFGFAEQVWLIKLDLITVDVKEISDQEIHLYELLQNYPNPFNPNTKISWQSPVGSWQTLKVYDVLGNEVATLTDEYKPAGSYEVEWNANNYPSGVYFYHLKAGNFLETKKMIIIK